MRQLKKQQLMYQRKKGWVKHKVKEDKCSIYGNNNVKSIICVMRVCFKVWWQQEGMMLSQWNSHNQHDKMLVNKK